MKGSREVDASLRYIEEQRFGWPLFERVVFL